MDIIEHDILFFSEEAHRISERNTGSADITVFERTEGQ